MMTRKLSEHRGQNETGYSFECPGCGDLHYIRTSSMNPDAAQWWFNGDMVEPTFRSSILARGYHGSEVVRVCHSFVVKGQIQFLSDCTHHLAGQTVPMLDEDVG